MALELDGRRKELCDWLTANHIDPDTVPLHADLTTDTVDGQRVIRYEALVRDGNGHLVADERGENAAVERRTVPLLVEPPDWWEPYEKPTRAQLLAAVERVRALHAAVPDHGRFTDGTCPDYCDGSHEEPPACLSCRTYAGDPVPSPCPTIRALNEEQP